MTATDDLPVPDIQSERGGVSCGDCGSDSTVVIANPDADERLVFTISAEFPESTSTGEQRFLDWVANYENTNVWNGCEYWMTVQYD